MADKDMSDVNEEVSGTYDAIWILVVFVNERGGVGWVGLGECKRHSSDDDGERGRSWMSDRVAGHD